MKTCSTCYDVDAQQMLVDDIYKYLNILITKNLMYINNDISYDTMESTTIGVDVKIVFNNMSKFIHSNSIKALCRCAVTDDLSNSLLLKFQNNGVHMHIGKPYYETANLVKLKCNLYEKYSSTKRKKHDCGSTFCSIEH